MKQNFLGNPEELKEESNEKMKQNSLAGVEERIENKPKTSKIPWIVGCVIVCLIIGIVCIPKSSIGALVNQETNISSSSSFDKQELFNKNDVKVYATSFKDHVEYDEEDYLALQLEIQNNRNDDINVFLDNLYINDCLFDSLDLESIRSTEKGKIYEDSVLIPYKSLDEFGITTISKVKVDVRVWTEDWDDLGEQLGTSFETKGGKGYVQVVDDSGKELLNNKAVRLVFKGTENYQGCTSLIFYVENKTDYLNWINSMDIKVNGKEYEDRYYGFILIGLDPNTKGMDKTRYFFSDEELQYNGLSSFEEIEKIEFTIRYDLFEKDDSWAFEEKDSDTIVINKADF